MSNLLEIVKRNNSTFYDNRSGKRFSLLPRLVGFAGVAAAVSLGIGTPSDTIVASVITVQAILVGFGFSVLFFLVSSEREDPAAAKSLEDKGRRQRLNKLSDELFYNISYYNIVTIFSVLLALVFAFDYSGVHSFYEAVEGVNAISEGLRRGLAALGGGVHRILIGFFYFVFFESIFTFYRIVVRVNFYFEQKRKVQSYESGS